MNIKIYYHVMPWEIDYALLTFIQLKKSKYHLGDNINITIETVLNLSNYIIDWDKSQLPKEFFIQKYNDISQLLVDYKHNKRIYDGGDLYGHLDLQKECISPEIDYYIGVCPDIYFSETLLFYLIEGIKSIKNKYFVLTPQISKLWDGTWDEITNNKFQEIDYSKWDESDIFDIRNISKQSEGEKTLYTTTNNKWAGWFDVYNKAFFEELCPVLPEMKGYGPWDWASMIKVEQDKKRGIDFKQYVLENEVIFEYSVGALKNKGFSLYYKNFIKLKDIPNQRQEFEKNMNKHIQKWMMNQISE